MSKYPIYQVKVRWADDSPMSWEERPVWYESIGCISLDELTRAICCHLRRHHAGRAREIRINEPGSYQGYYLIAVEREG